MGSNRHRCGRRAAHPHLLLLYYQKMLLQEEEEQEREERQGWLQHEEHAGRRGKMLRTCILKSQGCFRVMFCFFFSAIFIHQILLLFVTLIAVSS